MIGTMAGMAGGGYSVSGGDATSGNGDQSTGGSGFGDFNYNKPDYMLYGMIAAAALAALWLIKK